jgi:hypothetical protein
VSAEEMARAGGGEASAARAAARAERDADKAAARARRAAEKAARDAAAKQATVRVTANPDPDPNPNPNPNLKQAAVERARARSDSGLPGLIVRAIRAGHTERDAIVEYAAAHAEAAGGCKTSRDAVVTCLGKEPHREAARWTQEGTRYALTAHEVKRSLDGLQP